LAITGRNIHLNVWAYFVRMMQGARIRGSFPREKPKSKGYTMSLAAEGDGH